MNQPNTFKRLNITLNPETWERMKTVVPRMERSRFIDTALQIYLVNLKKRMLRKQLKKEALENVSEDMRVAKEWFNLDKEVWKKIK